MTVDTKVKGTWANKIIKGNRLSLIIIVAKERPIVVVTEHPIMEEKHLHHFIVGNNQPIPMAP